MHVLINCSPKSPSEMDWATYYPAYAISKEEEHGAKDESHDQIPVPSGKSISRPVKIADIGCGYGGLLFALAPKMPDTLMLGGFTIHSIASEFPQNV